MAKTVEIVRELKGWKGDAVLVKRDDGAFFVVSSVDAMFSGFETLAFPATADGTIESWCEVAGGRGVSREKTLRELGEN